VFVFYRQAYLGIYPKVVDCRQGVAEIKNAMMQKT